MSSERHSPSGPEGTLSAIGCVVFIFFAGIVTGIVLCVTYLKLTV